MDDEPFMGCEFSVIFTLVAVQPHGLRFLAWKLRRLFRDRKWHKEWIAPMGMPVLRPDGHVEQPAEQLAKINAKDE